MGFIRTTGEVLHETVAYVHNWPLYTLMVGGIPGLLAYGFLLLRPVVTPFQGHQMERTFLNVRAGLLLLCIYALFFAVMRLITFNLLIAAAWGITYAFVTKRDSLLKSRNAGIQA